MAKLQDDLENLSLAIEEYLCVEEDAATLGGSVKQDAVLTRLQAVYDRWKESGESLKQVPEIN